MLAHNTTAIGLLISTDRMFPPAAVNFLVDLINGTLILLLSVFLLSKLEPLFCICSLNFCRFKLLNLELFKFKLSPDFIKGDDGRSLTLKLLFNSKLEFSDNERIYYLCSKLIFLCVNGDTELSLSSFTPALFDSSNVRFACFVSDMILLLFIFGRRVSILFEIIAP